MNWGCRHKKQAVGLMMALATVIPLSANSAPNLNFHGTLIQEPCTVLPGDASVGVNFKSVIDKFLYRYQRSDPKHFQIRLSDCDLSIGQTLNLTFTGTESARLPGLLAVDPSSAATNIAIGLEKSDGTPVKINQSLNNIQLSSGETLLEFNAYVQGEPDALAQHSLSYGSFSATSVFLLEYP